MKGSANERAIRRLLSVPNQLGNSIGTGYSSYHDLQAILPGTADGQSADVDKSSVERLVNLYVSHIVVLNFRGRFGNETSDGPCSLAGNLERQGLRLYPPYE